MVKTTQLIAIAAIANIAISAAAQDNKLTINVAEAGTLPTLVSNEQKSSVTDLTVTGKLNGTDIRFLREMAGVDQYGSTVSGNSLKTLDFSGADIVEGGEPYYYTYTTADNNIGEFFFNSCTQLQSVKISETATRISWDAFGGCTSLTTFSVPDAVSYIDQAILENCTALESVTFGKGLKTIDGYNFSGCTSLKSIELPEGLEELNEYNFYNCTSLESVVVPGTVKSIGGYEFSGCTALTNVTIKDGVNELQQACFSECSGLQAIVLPNSITTIEEDAFDGCTSLTDITLPNKLETISDYMFSNCTALEHITIPESVTTIGYGAFCYDDHLLSINIHDNVTSIGESCFFDCEAMTEANIGSGLEDMGKNAFKFCEALQNINVSKDNKNYASVDGALYDKDITSLILLPANNCEEYTTPATVTNIGDNAAITNMRLKKLTIGENVTTIGEEAFEKCDNLEYIYIGSNVTTLGEDAFFMCEAIKELHSMTKEPLEIDTYMFWDVDKEQCTLYVPAGSIDLYKAAEGWKEFTKIEEADTNGIPEISTPANRVTVYDVHGEKVYDGVATDFKPAAHNLYIISDGRNSTKVAK